MKVLDLFSCEGGAAVGYARAGFEVEGVDVVARFGKRYPFRFFPGDAVRFAQMHGHRYDLIHASPPCQRYTVATSASRGREDYPDLIAEVRETLDFVGVPYIIENVPGAPLEDPVTLCGMMFGLTAVDDDGTELHLQRHRLFESNLPLSAPAHEHPPGVQWAGSYGGARRDKAEARNVRHGGYVPRRGIQQELLGIDWMTQHGMYQSVPPAYTEHLGRQAWDAIA